MTDAQTPTPAIDPVAEARKIMAAQGAAPADELASLKKQVKVLWALTIVALVLSLVAGGFSIFGRMLGIGRPTFGNGTFQPGQFRQNGTGGMQGVPGTIQQ